jgi:hypothetical protein
MLQIRTRSRKTLAAIGAAGLLALSAGAAFAFNALPAASDHGLQHASDTAGKTVPVRAVPDGVPPVDGGSATDDAAPNTPDTEDAQNEAAPPSDTHGAAVSVVAKAADTTPDTNHGADVSAIARANHGQAAAAQHRPADAGKPADVGKPDDPGKPTDPGKP